MKIGYLVTALLLSIVSAHAEDAVLVASTVKEYSPGLVIAEGTPLNIPAAGSAVLLFRSGAMIRINGPFKSPLTVNNSNVNSITSLVQELRSSGADASVIGASRAIPSAKNAMLAQRILIAPFHSAIYCIGDGDTVLLVRENSAGADVMRMRKGTTVVSVKWTATEVAWPTDIEIEDGDRIDTMGVGDEPQATLFFRRLGPEPSEMAWLADSLLLGCREQAAPALRELTSQMSKG